MAARNTRSTRNSQDAAFDANIPVSLPGGIPVSQPSSVPGSSGGTSLSATTPPLNTMAQLPPIYVTAIAQAVRDALAAEQAHAFHADTAISPLSVPSSVPATNVAMDIPPLPSTFGGTLGSQAAALLASGAGGLPSHWPTAPAGSSQGRPVVFPSFMSTFAPPIPSLATSGASVTGFALSAGLPAVPPSTSVLPAPILHQPFVVGPGFSPIPAKLVSQIVAGKFVELNELLSSNIVLTEPAPQLLFDGRLVLTSAPKKARCRIEDIATWMEAFSFGRVV